jgi:hypothetical protein
MYVDYLDSNGVDSNISKVSIVDGSIVNDKWSVVANSTKLGQMTIINDELFVINDNNLTQINLNDGIVKNPQWYSGLTSPIGIYNDSVDTIYVVSHHDILHPVLNVKYETSLTSINVYNGEFIKEEPYALGKTPIEVLPLYFENNFYGLTPQGITKTDSNVPIFLPTIP